MGEVAVTSETLSFARPATVAKADIKEELIAPARYEKGAEIAPALRLSDREGNQLAELPLAWEYRETGQPAASAAAPVERPDAALAFPFSPLETGLIALGAIAALLFLIRSYNLSRRKRHRRERAARLAAGVIDVAPEFQRRSNRKAAPAPQAASVRKRRPAGSQAAVSAHPEEVRSAGSPRI